MLKPELHLKLKNFTFAELFHADGLKRLDELFLQQLQVKNPAYYIELLRYREGFYTYGAVELSEWLLRLAPFVESFLITLFDIEEAAAISQAKTIANNPLAAFKKYYVLRRAKKDRSRRELLPPLAALQIWLDEELKKFPLQTADKELSIALLGNYFLSDAAAYADQIEKLAAWCTHALSTEEGQKIVAHWTSFHIPERLDYQNLVPTETLDLGLGFADHQLRLRDGFKLTDPRMTAREVQDEVNYCIYCHDHEGDFCSKGFPAKKGDPSQGLKKNSLHVIMTGCPLEEKISEMHWLKKEGMNIASLAMIMVDNPMCPATGHRICNDCMKACVYQKQEPVNIPQIETRVLMDVLDLPWGVEIYDLLTRWNPLRQKQWLMKPYNGLKILIAGMGPAGFTLAHHLLLEGFAVVGCDGLKIEPLADQWLHQPIYCFADMKESLDERVMAGFGGVAEYGITVRWDKNFLKLIYLSLMRRPHFQVFGNVRFGGTLTVEDAWSLGFDHFVIAVGAGLPKALSIPGSLAPGMRQANDFLMALQLGNAAKASSLTNLQVRLPAVVIGSGLTGVDTATEIQAYYIAQVEKILHRYETLTALYGEKEIADSFDPASTAILHEFLHHGKMVRQTREQAKARGIQPNFIKLLREWGGVTIAYRRCLQESPAYINNHEELKKAFEEGIFYREGLEPASVTVDEWGHAEALLCHERKRLENNEWETTPYTVCLPARSILVATGTQPNTAYEFEHRGTFQRLGLQYQHYEEKAGELTVAHGVPHCKDPQFGPFTSYHKEHYRVSLIGDTHPVFHGSVVKAIASGMRTYPKIMAVLANKLIERGDEKEYHAFAQRMNYLFQAHIHTIKRRSDKVLELVIHAPIAAHHFKAGQFYRLQNYETWAPHIDHTLCQMDPLALVAAEHDPQQGLLKFFVTTESATAKLCTLFKVGDPVSLMGPTGVRAKIPEFPETVLIIGNATGFPFLLSYGAELRRAGNKVIYVGYFTKKEDVYCQQEIENNTDMIIWLTQTGEAIVPQRRTDYSFTTRKEVINVLVEYAQEKISATPPFIPLRDVDRIFVMGNAEVLRHFQKARHTVLKEFLVKEPKMFGAVYGNMQCMLKGVCAQCLQWQIDPETGQRTKAVFACSWPDQPLEIIDTEHMAARQQQNRVHEILNNLWVDYLFAHYNMAHV
jgi:NADPH-dependent glutamate synthase beta subunit-like oxidoreductase/NAD(P)H-flavin reductase